MATIYDIARVAKTSPATVSRALSGTGSVREETRKKIKKIAREMNYSPNHLARSLVKKKTDTIALIISDITNPFFTAMARGVEDSAAKKGFNTILCNTDENEDKEKTYVDLMLERRVDGILVASCSEGKTLVELKKRDVPVVLVDRKISGTRWDWVVGDSEEGGYLLTRHLITVHDSRAIAMITGPQAISTSRERMDGYQRALVEFDIAPRPEWMTAGAYKEDFGHRIAVEYLRNYSAVPHAIFAGNNFIAMGIVKAAQEIGYRIPEDLLLVTFDDFEIASFMHPFLTVCKQPAYTMGSIATEFLLQRVGGEKIREQRKAVLKPEIIIRRSCGCGASPETAGFGRIGAMSGKEPITEERRGEEERA
ncbi:MAG TPA: LacI family DNA-binding transcriptional regulator [Atribacteraceae bacterium]|nr:LacI family DNA-binding transcriptional regulator [Atribacteraceae bacterium]